MSSTTKRIVVVVSLVSFACGLWAQQTVFVNTFQGFRSRVIDFREDGLRGCIREGVLVEPSPAELAVGDIFIDVDGNAKRVAAVQKVGKDIYIDTVQPSLEDVFELVYIPDQTIAFNEDNFSSNSVAAKGVSTAPRGTLGGGFDLYLYRKDKDNYVKFYGTAALTGGVSIGFLGPGWNCAWVEQHWGWFTWWELNWWYTQGYIRGSVGYDLTIAAGFEAAMAGSKESDPVLLYGFGTPTAGIEAGAGLYSKFILEGEAKLKVPVTFKVYGSVGAQCTLDGQFPVMWPSGVSTSGGTGYSLKLEPELEASVTLKHKLYLGTTITIVGIKVTNFEAGGGPYIKLSGKLSGEVGYDSATGLIPPSWSGQASGEIGLFLNISGSVCDGRWSVTVLDSTYPLCAIQVSTPSARGTNLYTDERLRIASGPGGRLSRLP